MPKHGFLELARRRKTTYDFSGKKVKAIDIQMVLEAGRWAPSSLNSQPWRFVVVQNKAAIDRLMRLCHYGAFHTNPNVLIAVVLEPLNLDQSRLSDVASGFFADSQQYLNVAMPALNMVFEATARGLGSCILSPESKVANAVLQVPKNRETVLLVGLGFEKKGAFQKPQERKELDEIVFFERYGGKKKF